jgi:hypothetical protein
MDWIMGSILCIVAVWGNSTGIADKSPKVMEKRFVRNYIAVLVVRGLVKRKQHLIWSKRLFLSAIEVVSFG